MTFICRNYLQPLNNWKEYTTSGPKSAALKFVSNKMFFKRNHYLRVELNCFEIFGALVQLRMMVLVS